MNTPRFALFGNVEQVRNSEVSARFVEAIKAQGAEVTVVGDGPLPRADFAVSMGGDGTFLRTASRVLPQGMPIIGINMGRLGFLADVSSGEIDRIVECLMSGTYRVEERTVLQIAYSDGWPNGVPFALNEVAVSKLDNSSMIAIRVDVDGQYLTTYQADGLIINTPTGSTGYALSVGGPIMSPDAPTLGITPVAPHSLSVRPVVLGDEAVIDLTVRSRSHNFLVALDGRSETCADRVSLQVRKAESRIKVIKLPESSFYNTLRNKLMWGNDVRN